MDVYLLSVHLSPHVLAKEGDDFKIIGEEAPAHIAIFIGKAQWSIGAVRYFGQSCEAHNFCMCWTSAPDMTRKARKKSIARIAIDENNFMDGRLPTRMNASSVNPLWTACVSAIIKIYHNRVSTCP